MTEDVKIKKKLNEDERKKEISEVGCKTSFSFEIVLDENQNRSERVKVEK